MSERYAAPGSFVEHLRELGLPEADVQAYAQCVDDSVDQDIPEMLAGLPAPRRPTYVEALRLLAEWTGLEELASEVEKWRQDA